MGKKDREEKCLKDTLALCPTHRGDTRRILKRLIDATNCEGHERPDFVFTVRPGSDERETLIGLEHFAVDQCCEEQRSRKGAVNSLREKNNRYGENLRLKYLDVIRANDELPEEAIKESLDLVSRAISDVHSTSYAEYMTSFTTIFAKHLEKVDEYQKKLRAMVGDDASVSLGFLVELHSNMSRNYLVSGKEVRRCKPGEALVFSEMLELMRKASGRVDFIILSFCDAVGAEAKNVLALDCGNIDKSIARQRVVVCDYAGDDADLRAFEPLKKSELSKGTINYRGDEISTTIEVETRVLDDEAMRETAIRNALRLHNAIGGGRACVVSDTALALYSAFENSPWRDYIWRALEARGLGPLEPAAEEVYCK